MKKNGFTLVELIVVIAIVGIIAIIAGSNYSKVINDNKKQRCEQTRILLEQKALDYHNKLTNIDNNSKVYYYDINTIAEYYDISLDTLLEKEKSIEVTKKGVNGLLEAFLSEEVCNEE